MQRTPAILLSDIECAIRPLIEHDGGELNVVSNLDEALELAGKAPNSWRVILNFDGYGSHPAAINGMSNVRFVTIVQVNIGMTVKPGERLYKTGIQGQPSFISRLEQVSLWMRSLHWPDGSQVDCRGLALEGSEWVGDSPAKTSSKALNWEIGMALPNFKHHIHIPLIPIQS